MKTRSVNIVRQSDPKIKNKINSRKPKRRVLGAASCSTLPSLSERLVPSLARQQHLPGAERSGINPDANNSKRRMRIDSLSLSHSVEVVGVSGGAGCRRFFMRMIINDIRWACSFTCSGGYLLAWAPAMPWPRKGRPSRSGHEFKGGKTFCSSPSRIIFYLFSLFFNENIILFINLRDFCCLADESCTRLTHNGRALREFRSLSAETRGGKICFSSNKFPKRERTRRTG